MTPISTNYANNTQKSSGSAVVQGNDAQKANGKKDIKKDAKGNNVSGDSVYGGSLNLDQDIIGEKKAQAGKQALKRIMDQFSGENKVDQELASRESHIQDMENEMLDNQGQVRDIESAKSDLMQEYKVDPDSQEQQDLGLLEKRQDILKGRSRQTLTDEETARLKEIDAAGGPNEYQSRELELDDREAAFKDRIADADKNRAEDTGVVKGIHKARLKLHEMVNADKDAQQILDNASKEITGMLMKQAVDTQDKQMDDIKEAAKKKKEEKEKQDETKTQNTQNTNNTNNTNNTQNTSNTQNTNNTQNANSTNATNHAVSDTATAKQVTVNKDVQQEILQAKADQMIAEKKMTQEDIKGIACDEKV